jgi:hypothetical protein
MPQAAARPDTDDLKSSGVRNEGVGSAIIGGIDKIGKKGIELSSLGASWTANKASVFAKTIAIKDKGKNLASPPMSWNPQEHLAVLSKVLLSVDELEQLFYIFRSATHRAAIMAPEHFSLLFPPLLKQPHLIQWLYQACLDPNDRTLTFRRFASCASNFARGTKEQRVEFALGIVYAALGSATVTQSSFAQFWKNLQDSLAALGLQPFESALKYV